MAIKIGITGGIGSGKSVVSHLLEIMNIPVYISDVASKELTNSDPEIRRELISLLGEDVYVNDELNKPLVASYLFKNQENAARINGIIHPRVKQDFRTWTANYPEADIVGIESAILMEAGFSNEVDKIVMVYSPLDVRIKRVMKRDSSSYEEILQRINRQMDDEIKKEKADFIIFNDEETPLIPQVEKLLYNLRNRG